MDVFYDRKNDVVSVYFNLEEESNLKQTSDSSEDVSNRDYEVDEAANLILDMIDIVDHKGNLKGFRVFNASRHYDSALLDCAEPEELEGQEIISQPSERIIARLGGKKL